MTRAPELTARALAHAIHNAIEDEGKRGGDPTTMATTLAMMTGAIARGVIEGSGAAPEAFRAIIDTAITHGLTLKPKTGGAS